MTSDAIKSLVNDLDSSDLFLRNRSKCATAPLNEYDIMLLSMLGHDAPILDSQIPMEERQV